MFARALLLTTATLLPAAAALAGSSGVRLDPDFGGDGRINYAASADSLRAVAHLAHPQGGSVGVLHAREDDPVLCPEFEYCLTLVRVQANGNVSDLWSIGPDIPFSHVTAAAIDADGSVVVAGDVRVLGTNTDIRVARILPNGQPDTNFGTGGMTDITFDIGGNKADYARAVAIDGSGRIVVAGEAAIAGDDIDFAVARLLPNGAPDNTFAGNGQRTIGFDLGGTTLDWAEAMAVDAAGYITLAGYANDRTSNITRVGVARLRPDGGRDTTLCPGSCNDNSAYPTIHSGRRVTFFGAATDLRSTILSSLAIDADGRIALAGIAQTPGGYTGYVQLLAANGDRLHETTTDGGWPGTPSIGSVLFATPSLPDSRIVLTGVTGDTLHSFFVQAFDATLAPVPGWGYLGEDASAYTWTATDQLFDPGQNEAATGAMAPGGRILTGGSFLLDDAATLKSATLARLVGPDLFRDGLEGGTP